jgi:hypothetical protein
MLRRSRPSSGGRIQLPGPGLGIRVEYVARLTSQPTADHNRLTIYDLETFQTRERCSWRGRTSAAQTRAATVPFDPAEPGFYADPYVHDARLRRHSPVHQHNRRPFMALRGEHAPEPFCDSDPISSAVAGNAPVAALEDVADSFVGQL